MPTYKSVGGMWIPLDDTTKKELEKEGITYRGESVVKNPITATGPQRPGYPDFDLGLRKVGDPPPVLPTVDQPVLKAKPEPSKGKFKDLTIKRRPGRPRSKP